VKLRRANGNDLAPPPLQMGGGKFGTDVVVVDGDDAVAVVGEREKVKRYDANVLTKVIVYGGIAFLAAGVIPVMFELLGWGVYSA